MKLRILIIVILKLPSVFPDRYAAMYPEWSHLSTRIAMSTQYWRRSFEKSHLIGAGGSLRYLTVDGA